MHNVKKLESKMRTLEEHEMRMATSLRTRGDSLIFKICSLVPFGLSASPLMSCTNDWSNFLISVWRINGIKKKHFQFWKLRVRFFAKIQDQIKNPDHKDFSLRKETMSPKVIDGRKEIYD